MCSCCVCGGAEPTAVELADPCCGSQARSRHASVHQPGKVEELDTGTGAGHWKCRECLTLSGWTPCSHAPGSPSLTGDQGVRACVRACVIRQLRDRRACLSSRPSPCCEAETEGSQWEHAAPLGSLNPVAQASLGVDPHLRRWRCQPESRAEPSPATEEGLRACWTDC